MTEIAPGIRRVGQSIVACYLVETDGELVLVDAGAPAYWRELEAELAALGRTPGDIRAVLLTHGHPDHIGIAERTRAAGMPVRIHEQDAALARGEAPNQIRIAGRIRPGSILGFLATYVRLGLLRVPKIREVITFGDGATLDVPGTPRVIHVPGHTPGSAALHFAGHDALFTGDAINTYAVTSGRRGPQLSPFNADRAMALDSLARLEDLEAGLLLPGHGEPWRQGMKSALAAARATDAGLAAAR